MFSLLSGFWQYFFAKTEVHVLILGLDHAGKTTLLEQMKGIFKKTPGIPPDRIPPTIGLNIGKMDVDRSRVIFWDLGGQVRMRSIWEKYYAEAHGLVFVIDSADSNRVREAKAAFDAARENEQMGRIPIMILANKQDLPGATRADDIEVLFSVSSADPLVRVQPASCLTCEGIEDGVRWVVNTASQQLRGFNG